MEYVVFEAGGKQYKVTAGDILEVDNIKSSDGSISFDKVLLHVSDGTVMIGKPYLEQINITAKVLENFKGKKIRVGRFTAKSRHRRVIGFRPSLTRVQIEKISTASSKPASTKTPKTKK